MSSVLSRRGASHSVRGWAVTLAVGIAVVLAAAIVELQRTDSPASAVKTLVAAAIAVALGALAVTMPGINLRGVVIGAVFAAAGVFTWTFTSHPIVIWAVLAVGGVVFAAWSWPWFARLGDLRRLGGAWLGLPYWVFGVAGAVLVWHVTVAGQRVAYAGVFALAAMAVVATVRRSAARGGGDPTIGIAVAMLVAVAVLLLAGADTMFDRQHAVPDNFGAQLMRDRFWGGSGLFFQPNSLAAMGIVAAMRLAPDRSLVWWRRLAVALATAFVLYLTNGRTAWGMAVIAALVHAALVLRWRRADLPSYRHRWVAVLTPLVLLVAVFAASGGSRFLDQSRFPAHQATTPAPPSSSSGHHVATPPAQQHDVTSGRIDTWKQVASDWYHASVPEKIFGDARTSRAVVTRANDAVPGVKPAQLNTDSAVVGSFRRGGVLGAIAFLFGLVLLVWRAVFHRSAGGAPPPAWFTITVLAVVPSVLVEDWLLGGTNGVIWILLLAGEACLLWPSRPRTAGRGTSPGLTVATAILGNEDNGRGGRLGRKTTPVQTGNPAAPANPN